MDLIDAAKNASQLAEQWKYAKDAYVTAESVFFDETMLSLLYFPDEHKYAVYLPLFLPILLPLVGSLKHILRGWRTRKEKVQ